MIGFGEIAWGTAKIPMKILTVIKGIAVAATLLPASVNGVLAQADQSAAVQAVVRLCDTLAADPEDNGRPEDVPGVAFDKVDVGTATAGCQAAVAIASDVPRMAYNLGRTLVASGNFIDAIVPLRAASDTGYGAADRVVGDMYAKGQGFAADAAKAEEYYTRAAAAGDSSVLLRQIDALLSSTAEADKQRAKELLRQAADKGNPRAQLLYAVQLEQKSEIGWHEGPEADLLLAEDYLTRAVKAGWPGARRELAELRLSGKPFDQADAQNDLIALAGAGDPWAMTELADGVVNWSSGPFAALSPTEQFDLQNEWLKKAAAMDYPEALYDLGSNYDWGAGTLEKNKAESERLFQRAAELGHPGAAASLGFILYQAADTDDEYAVAAKWFTLARDSGEADGALGLGHLYSSGLGVRLDFAAAIQNYSIALDQSFSGIAGYQLARIYDSAPGYLDHDKAAEYLIRAIDEVGGPEEQAQAGFKELSRATRVALQQALIAKGLLKGTADGSFGPASLAAYYKTSGWR